MITYQFIGEDAVYQFSDGETTVVFEPTGAGDVYQFSDCDTTIVFEDSDMVYQFGIDETTIIFDSEPQTNFVFSDVPGPQGPPGPAGGSVVQYPAGENLSAGRVVIIEGGEALYFQPSTPAHGGRAFGVTTTSALTGETVNIQVVGEPADASFSAFSDVPLYVGDDGEIQTTFPASGLIQKAGFGTGTNKIMIDFSTQILQ